MAAKRSVTIPKGPYGYQISLKSSIAPYTCVGAMVDVVREKSREFSAGLRPGDTILSINEETTVGKSYNEVYNMIKESSGSSLQLVVIGNATDEPRSSPSQSEEDLSASRHKIDDVIVSVSDDVDIGRISSPKSEVSGDESMEPPDFSPPPAPTCDDVIDYWENHSNEARASHSPSTTPPFYDPPTEPPGSLHETDIDSQLELEEYKDAQSTLPLVDSTESQLVHSFVSQGDELYSVHSKHSSNPTDEGEEEESCGEEDEFCEPEKLVCPSVGEEGHDCVDHLTEQEGGDSLNNEEDAQQPRVIWKGAHRSPDLSALNSKHPGQESTVRWLASQSTNKNITPKLSARSASDLRSPGLNYGSQPKINFKPRKSVEPQQSKRIITKQMTTSSLGSADFSGQRPVQQSINTSCSPSYSSPTNPTTFDLPASPSSPIQRVDKPSQKDETDKSKRSPNASNIQRRGLNQAVPSTSSSKPLGSSIDVLEVEEVPKNKFAKLFKGKSKKHHSNESNTCDFDYSSSKLPDSIFIQPLQNQQPGSISEYIPLIVELCTAIVEEFGLYFEGIYRKSPNATAIKDLTAEFHKEPSDMNSHLARWMDVHAVAGLLKKYISQLPQLLVPEDYRESILSVCRQESLTNSEAVMKLKQLLSPILPASGPTSAPYRYQMETLRHILGHLSRLARYESVHRMGSSNLALIFVPSLLCPQHEDIMKDNDAKKRFLQLSIEYYSWIFCDNDSETPCREDWFDNPPEIPSEDSVGPQKYENACLLVEHILSEVHKTGRKVSLSSSTSPTTDHRGQSKKSDHKRKDHQRLSSTSIDSLNTSNNHPPLEGTVSNPPNCGDHVSPATNRRRTGSFNLSSLPFGSSKTQNTEKSSKSSSRHRILRIPMPSRNPPSPQLASSWDKNLETKKKPKTKQSKAKQQWTKFSSSTSSSYKYNNNNETSSVLPEVSNQTAPLVKNKQPPPDPPPRKRSGPPIDKSKRQGFIVPDGQRSELAQNLRKSAGSLQMIALNLGGAFMPPGPSIAARSQPNSGQSDDKIPVHLSHKVSDKQTDVANPSSRHPIKREPAHDEEDHVTSSDQSEEENTDDEDDDDYDDVPTPQSTLLDIPESPVGVDRVLKSSKSVEVLCPTSATSQEDERSPLFKASNTRGSKRLYRRRSKDTTSSSQDSGKPTEPQSVSQAILMETPL